MKPGRLPVWGSLLDNLCGAAGEAVCVRRQSDDQSDLLDMAAVYA